MPAISRCPVTGKVRFPDSISATRALHQAVLARAYAELAGSPSRRTECRKYECRLCGGWHLTSQVEAGVVVARASWRTTPLRSTTAWRGDAGHAAPV